LTRQKNHQWCRQVAWHKVTEDHRTAFCAVVRKRLQLSIATYRLDMLVVEMAILEASRRALPHTRPLVGKAGVFWTDAARRAVDAAAERFGGGAVAEISNAHAKVRRQTLADNADVTADPSSCWSFVRRFFAFKQDSSLRPPLETDVPGEPAAVSYKERTEALGSFFASVHANAELAETETSRMDAQGDLAAVTATIPAHTQGGARLGVTELRACMAEMKTGKCSDFLGIKTEHLRLLDDAAIQLMVPFLDRCLSHGTLPSHWRSACVTPVPKRGRDLTLCRSWRPVSVTPLLCRLCEAVVHNRVQHVIEQHGHRRGKSQFGFRRGVGTPLPVSGLSMFISDGLDQQTPFAPWDAKLQDQRVSRQWGASQGASQQCTRHHATLLVSIDGSDAFCRALPAKVVSRVLAMGLPDEARWIAALLTDRTLAVKEGGFVSSQHALARGVPQGSILGPMLWSLVIDDLIARCEDACRQPLPGCVCVPIVFADDINFAVRGFNPTSLVEQANLLLAVVRDWSRENGVPMAKLQASWIVGGRKVNWARLWTSGMGEVKFDDQLKCTPSMAPIKLLGVTFDSSFTFAAHVDGLIETCERYLRLLSGMARVVKAEKLAILYRGLILSRMLYAVDAWYPFVSALDRQRLQSLHYRACCVITGCVSTSHAESVCYEAGFRCFDAIARDEMVKLADRLRRVPDGCIDNDTPSVCFGPEWVARLFRDGAMPTAELRAVIRADGEPAARDPKVWPPPGFHREARATNQQLRDVGMTLACGDARAARRDTRLNTGSCRPLPLAHPWPPQDLALFDDFVRFVTDAPGGLVKPDGFQSLSTEDKLPFADANCARMAMLVETSKADALFIYTDAARVEKSGSSRGPKCAGFWAVCDGHVAKPGTILERQAVGVSPIACSYSAELASISGALQYVLANAATLFAARPNRRVVLVTDSKSALESLQATWTRRIGRLEQETCRTLHGLAALGVHTTLAFVFAHAGGAPGNDFADRNAQLACERIGGCWIGDLWHADTTRCILKKRHDALDAAAGVAASGNRGLAFRFRSVPRRVGKQPSAPLPRALPRTQEVLLYRARLGMVVAAGGAMQGLSESCPLCGEEDAMCRDGGALTHLVECLQEFTEPPLKICVADLWQRPEAAAEQLALATACIRQTPEGRMRAATWASRTMSQRRQ
jgi:hypothetical protein